MFGQLLKQATNKHLKLDYKQLALFRYATHYSQTVSSHLSEALGILSLNTSRLLKTIFILGCTSTFLTAILIPLTEGYGDFVATVVFIFLCPFLLIYCIHAFKIGEIEIKSFTVKRSDSPGGFWFGIVIYSTFAISVLSIMFWRTYT